MSEGFKRRYGRWGAASESESVWKEVERGSDVRGVQAVYVQGPARKGLRLIRDGDDATME